MKFTRLADWLQWLEAHHPSEIDLGLARIVQVARRMNLLTSSAKVVTVAGTNGKGSCVAAVAALMVLTPATNKPWMLSKRFMMLAKAFLLPSV